MQLRLVWITCLIIISTAVALWMQNQRNNSIETEKQSNTNEEPASVLFKDIEMTINTAAGTPQYKLSAPIYKHYHAEQRGEFKFPDIVIFPENGNLVFAQSEKGETRENNSVITLLGQVEIRQPHKEKEENNNSYELEINTDKLVVFPKQQRATTDSKVSATRGPNTVTALGMTIDLEKEILHLHDEVQGHYKSKL